jgi:hypothetical protein
MDDLPKCGSAKVGQKAGKGKKEMVPARSGAAPEKPKKINYPGFRGGGFSAKFRRRALRKCNITPGNRGH